MDFSLERDGIAIHFLSIFAGVAALAGLTNLVRLSLGARACPASTLVAAFAPLGASPSLDLGMCPHVTDRGLASLASITSIQILDLSGADHVSDAGLLSIGKLTRVHTLGLGGCKRLSDVALANVLGGLSRLTDLDISECSQVFHRSTRHLELIVYVFCASARRPRLLGSSCTHVAGRFSFKNVLDSGLS